MSIPTVSDIDRISALRDPVERNRQITQCYYELSIALAPVVGAGANWCTFATWASRQAGQTIRGEDLKQAFEDCLRGSTELAATLALVARTAAGSQHVRDVDAFVRRLTDTLDLEAAFARASDAVARGNRKVFDEIAREFARFLETLGADTELDQARVAAFCSGLRDGDPPDGQRHLREAFATYARARFEIDAIRRAQSLYHANLLVGFHEQTRLQPEITEAISTTLGDPADVKRRIRSAILPGVWASIINAIGAFLGLRRPLDPLLDRLVALVVRTLRQVITASLMTLHMPRGVVLRLAHDLTGEYPASLAAPTDVALVKLLSAIDPTPNSLRDSGTHDWADFRDRMHFIAELFRTRHEDAAMFDAPYSD
jgi:hypothetical protein